MATFQLPDWLLGRWVLNEWIVTHQGNTTTFPAGAGPIQIALTLAFARGSTTYEYGGGPVAADWGEIVSAGSGSVKIGLWPTNVPSLPATIAPTAKGIVVEFSHTIWGNEPSDFKAFYGPA